MELRKRPEPVPELLIVDSGNLMEAGAAAEMLLTLIEMDAASLVIQTPILGFSEEKAGSEEEIRSWFEDEFSLLERNIRNLFEAIRVGSVAPTEARRYVEELVGLTDQGKERLTAALIRQGGAGTARLEQTAAAFGRIYQAGDLRLPPGIPIPAGNLSYSRPRRDWDGRIRRIAPAGPPEHVIYTALKGRFAEALVWTAGEAPLLITTNAEGGETQIPLDSRSQLLFEPPGGEGNEEFRRIPLEFFTRYEERGQTLQRLLREADRLGIYGGLAPERSPLYIFEYALVQREEFLRSLGSPSDLPPAQWKGRWLRAREDYFTVLEEFLYGPAEEGLVRAGRAASERPAAPEGEEAETEQSLGTEAPEEEAEAERIKALEAAFDGLREAYTELRTLRDALSWALSSSLVILGPREEPAAPAEEGRVSAAILRLPGGREYSDSELSFILADNILLGRGIRPAGRLDALLWPLLAAALELLILIRLRPLFSLGMGLIFSLAGAAGFSGGFIFSGLWIDPLIPLGASLAGALTVFILSLAAVSRGARRFRLAYGPYTGKPFLKQIIKAGRPAPNDRLSVQAAVIAVRQAGLLAGEDRAGSAQGARAAAAFREDVRSHFTKAGGVILGCEGDLVLACFGSPLERIGMGPGRDPYLRYSRSPALRAAEFVTDLAALKGQWQFGIDLGECSFGYQRISGYNGYGRPVVRARILSGLAARYRARVLVSESVYTHVKDIPVRKISILKELDGTGGEAFYELILPR
jgi:class 3 adenylate cyclase